MKKFREEHGRFVIEGERLVSDAWNAGAKIFLAIVASDRVDRYAELLSEMEEVGIPVLESSPKLFERICDTRQPQGIAVEAELPVLNARAALNAVDIGQPATVLWEISDPGNFGTVIRTTDWFGVKGLLFSSESADPFNSKVVRGTMGSLFRVQLGAVDSFEELQRLAKESGRELVATVAEGGTDARAWKTNGRELLVFGSEAHGLPAELLDQIPKRIRITGGSAESLNLGISHGILMHALTSGKA